MYALNSLLLRGLLIRFFLLSEDSHQLLHWILFFRLLLSLCLRVLSRISRASEQILQCPGNRCGVVGVALEISRAAVRPLSMPRMRSRMTTSGFSSAVFRTAPG